MSLHKGQTNSGSFKKGEHRSKKTEFKKGKRASPKTEFGKKPAWNKGTKGVVVPWNKGKRGIYSKETIKKISNKLRKKTTPIKRALRDHFKSIAWRSSIFERDNYECQDCGKKGYLEAHHKKPFIQIIEDNNIKTLKEGIFCNELWDLDNGITLCKGCHKKRHKKEGYRR